MNLRWPDHKSDYNQPVLPSYMQMTVHPPPRTTCNSLPLITVKPALMNESYL